MTVSVSSLKNRNDIRSTLELWAAGYTTSDAERVAIVSRTLMIAADDDALIEASCPIADLRKLLDQIAKQTITAVDFKSATSPDP